MTNFTYNQNIPDGPNNPSADQPKMKVNTNSIAGILDVDLVSFGQNNGGTHKQSTYVTENPPLLAPIGVSSVAYTNAGQIDVTKPQYFWQSSDGTFPLSGIKAFGYFVTQIADGPIALPLNACFNVLSITKLGIDYTINLKPNTIKTDRAIVIVSAPQFSLNIVFINQQVGIDQIILSPVPQVSGIIFARRVNFIALQI